MTSDERDDAGEGAAVAPTLTLTRRDRRRSPMHAPCMCTCLPPGDTPCMGMCLPHQVTSRCMPMHVPCMCTCLPHQVTRRCMPMHGLCMCTCLPPQVMGRCHIHTQAAGTYTYTYIHISLHTSLHTCYTDNFRRGFGRLDITL